MATLADLHADLHAALEQDYLHRHLFAHIQNLVSVLLDRMGFLEIRDILSGDSKRGDEDSASAAKRTRLRV